MSNETPHASGATGAETELKLALPTHAPAELARRLSRAAVLNRRTPVQQQLHNVYFDTPSQQLRGARAALRIRRIETDGPPQWLQTLKTAPQQDGSALSQRGEWESPVDGPELQRSALDAAAWSAVDPDGSVFDRLRPCFVTTFTRTIWLVRRRDRALVEVAFDAGSVRSGERISPICELELERKSGPVGALFDVAQRIAATVPVLPLGMSKAQRGYALDAGTIHAPTIAAPPRLAPGVALETAAPPALRAMFGQFTANLLALCHSDDADIVRQAHIAWRHLCTARRLFEAVLPARDQPDWTALCPLLECLGKLRDLDVARTDTVPLLRDTDMAASVDRTQALEAFMPVLDLATAVQRSAARRALETPAVGLCLLQATRWLELGIALSHADAEPAPAHQR